MNKDNPLFHRVFTIFSTFFLSYSRSKGFRIANLHSEIHGNNPAARSRSSGVSISTPI